MDQNVWLAGLISMSLILLVQIVVSVEFFKKTRRIAEVGRLPRIMIVLSNLSSIAEVANMVFMHFGRERLHGTARYAVFGLIQAMIQIPKFINVVSWIRFLRV